MWKSEQAGDSRLLRSGASVRNSDTINPALEVVLLELTPISVKFLQRQGGSVKLNAMVHLPETLKLVSKGRKVFTIVVVSTL